MSGKEKKAAALEEKLQLKDKVVDEAAADDSSSISTASSSSAPLQGMVSVSSVDLDSKSSSSSMRGFQINVSMERSRPGLLVSVLEAFEELGLDILDADVSCADDDTPFRLQALGGHKQGVTVDESMVRQAVLEAITRCMHGS